MIRKSNLLLTVDSKYVPKAPVLDCSAYLNLVIYLLIHLQNSSVFAKLEMKPLRAAKQCRPPSFFQGLS